MYTGAYEPPEGRKERPTPHYSVKRHLNMNACDAFLIWTSNQVVQKCCFHNQRASVVVELELRYVQRPLLRAGASQPSRTAGSDLSIYIGIYTRRMHGIVGERERSNCVVDMSYKHVLRSKHVIVGTCTWYMKYAA